MGRNLSWSAICCYYCWLAAISGLTAVVDALTWLDAVPAAEAIAEGT